MFTTTIITLAILAHALGIWGAVDVIMKGRTAQGTTAWALALVFTPWVSLPLYMVFGERKFEGYVRARRSGIREIDHAAASLAEELCVHELSLSGPRAGFAALARLSRMPFTKGNQAELLIDGHATFDAIFAAIQNASHYILVQFYIYRDDAIGKRLAELLIAARARGVRVMLIYDETVRTGLKDTSDGGVRVARAARASAMELAGGAKEKALQARETIGSSIAERPFTSVAIAAGVGAALMGLALMWKRR